MGTILLVLLLGTRLLPNRPSHTVPVDLEILADTLRRDYGLTSEDELVGPLRGVTEALVPPRSPLIGLHVFPGMTTPSGDLVILGIRRGEDIVTGADNLLRAGDALLLDGTWDDLHRHTESDREVLVVDTPSRLRRGIPLGQGATRVLVVLTAMVVLLVTGAVPPAVAGLGAAVAVVLLRVVNAQQAYRSISWTTVVLIAGMIPLSTAFRTTGAAELLATGLKNTIGGAGPTVALAAIVLLTLGLGQLISNTATVLIIAPVAVALAAAMEVSVLPFLMALTVAGSASYLTPIATPANMMVMEPGNYQFGDYARFGIPFALLSFILAVFYVPLVWPFTALG